MKKIIYYFAILFLIIISVLNFLFTANLDAGENITINNESEYFN